MSLWDCFRLHFSICFGCFGDPPRCKIPKRTIQESMKKTRRTKTPKSDKSETPEASQRVTLSWGNLADWTIRSVLGCKGYPRIVPGLLRTPFSSILATKTIHCTSVLTDAQPTRFPNKYMPSFPLSSFKTTLLPIRWQAHDVYLRSRCYDMSYILYNMNHNIYIYLNIYNMYLL